MEINMQSGRRTTPCFICGDLLQDPTCALRVMPKTWHPRFSDIVKSSDAGCTFCSAIMNALLIYVPFNILSRDFIRIPPQISEKQDSTLEVQVQTWAPLAFITASIEIFTTSKDVQKYCTGVPLRRHISPDSSSPECFANAKGWLQECLKHHKCPKNVNQKLPKRIISVGSHGSKLFLHEPSSGERGCWAALSYRWGERRFLTTLLSIEDRKGGFDPEELPRTCRDAVIVARALNIPYLWIDAICIVQGDETSWVWQKEVAEMCSIYEKAVVTIAAVDGKDSDAGLFKLGPRRQAAPFKVSPLNNSTMTIFARRAPINGPYGYMSRNRREDDRGSGSLHTRGWTLQEITLSTRILWFTRSELGFTCPISRASQCQPRLIIWDKVRPAINNRHTNVHSMVFDELSLIEWMGKWMCLVGDYTSRDLAKKTDRLPALHGLMMAMRQRAGGNFYAGVWSIHLARQLVWKTDHEGEPTDMGNDYAPSWSWASLSHHVHYYRDTQQTVIPVWEDVRCRVFESNRELLGCGTGILTIRTYAHAVVFSGDILFLDNPEKTLISERKHFRLDRRMNFGGLDMLQEKNLSLIIAQRFVDNEVYIRVRERHRNKEIWPGDLSFDGLLLEAVTGTAGAFRRLGYLTSYSITWEKLKPLLVKQTITII